VAAGFPPDHKKKSQKNLKNHKTSAKTFKKFSQSTQKALKTKKKSIKIHKKPLIKKHWFWNLSRVYFVSNLENKNFGLKLQQDL
jgi:hypothetical protein